MDEVVYKKAGQGNLRLRKIVEYIAGVLEVLFACRFVLKFLGANSQNVFVSYVYSLSKSLLLPFVGIFSTAVTKGVATKSIFEPSTLIGMVVYALVACGIIKLIEIMGASRYVGIKRVK